MLTDNIIVPDRLINGSVVIDKQLDRRSKPLCSTIYVKFGDPKAGNSLKDRSFPGELKECAPITARTKKFPLKKGKSTVIAKRKRFLLILGYPSIVHKFHVSTLAYMQGDLNRSTSKKTTTGMNYQQPVSQGQLYTLLSRAKYHDKVLLLNFEPEDIKINESALEEMIRMWKLIIFQATPLNRIELY